MVIAANLSKITERILSADEKLPVDQQSIFLIKTLKRSQLTRLMGIFWKYFGEEDAQEQSVSQMLSKIDDLVEFHADLVACLQIGLDGWRTVNDEDGTPVEPVKDKSGVLSADCLEWIDLTDMLELVMIITEVNNPSEGDQGN